MKSGCCALPAFSELGSFQSCFPRASRAGTGCRALSCKAAEGGASGVAYSGGGRLHLGDAGKLGRWEREAEATLASDSERAWAGWRPLSCPGCSLRLSDTTPKVLRPGGGFGVSVWPWGVSDGADDCATEPSIVPRHPDAAKQTGRLVSVPSTRWAARCRCAAWPPCCASPPGASSAPCHRATSLWASARVAHGALPAASRPPARQSAGRPSRRPCRTVRPGSTARGGWTDRGWG